MKAMVWEGVGFAEHADASSKTRDTTSHMRMFFMLGFRG
jgi:hypothetical protein